MDERLFLVNFCGSGSPPLQTKLRLRKLLTINVLFLGGFVKLTALLKSRMQFVWSMVVLMVLTIMGAYVVAHPVRARRSTAAAFVLSSAKARNACAISIITS